MWTSQANGGMGSCGGGQDSTACGSRARVDLATLPEAARRQLPPRSHWHNAGTASTENPKRHSNPWAASPSALHFWPSSSQLCNRICFPERGSFWRSCASARGDLWLGSCAGQENPSHQFSPTLPRLRPSRRSTQRASVPRATTSTVRHSANASIAPAVERVDVSRRAAWRCPVGDVTLSARGRP